MASSSSSFLFRKSFSTLSQLFLRPSRIPHTVTIPNQIPHTDAIPNQIPHTVAIPNHHSDKKKTYSAAYRCFKLETDPVKILAIFNSISGDPTTTVARMARELVVKRLAREKQFSDIEVLLEKQKRICETPTEKFFTSIIISYGKAGMLDQAIQTFNQIEKRGVRPTSLAFNALLTACNRAKRFDQVPNLFSEIPKNIGISPDKISYGILVKSLCESGSLQTACLILDEMEKKNVEITSVTYTAILNGCYENNMVEQAEKIWTQMREKGFLIDASFYNAKILYSARNGNLEEVSRLIEEMACVGVKPTTQTYNISMSFYFKSNLIEDAKKVYENMEINGCFPNKVTFRILTYYLCKNGDYLLALTVAKRCLSSKMVLNFGTLKCLIEGLREDLKFMESKGSIDVLKELIKVSKKWYPKRFAIELEKLEMRLDEAAVVEGSVTRVNTDMNVEEEESDGTDEEDELEICLGLKKKL